MMHTYSDGVVAFQIGDKSQYVHLVIIAGEIPMKAGRPKRGGWVYSFPYPVGTATTQKHRVESRLTAHASRGHQLCIRAVEDASRGLRECVLSSRFPQQMAEVGRVV